MPWQSPSRLPRERKQHTTKYLTNKSSLRSIREPLDVVTEPWATKPGSLPTPLTYQRNQGTSIFSIKEIPPQTQTSNPSGPTGIKKIITHEISSLLNTPIFVIKHCIIPSKPNGPKRNPLGKRPQPSSLMNSLVLLLQRCYAYNAGGLVVAPQ